MRTAFVSTAICLAVAGVSAAGPASAAISRATDIPPEGLASALQTFAKDYGVQVLYRTEVVGNLQTHGASGTMTASEALTRVLADTGLSYKYLDDRTITIVSTVPAAPRAAASPADTGAPGAADAAKEGKRDSSRDFRLAQLDQAATAGSAALGTRGEQRVEPPGNAMIEEVIVTATKRNERLQDAPVSINAIEGDRLQELGITSFADFAQLVPGMNVAGSSAPGVGTIIIRGLYSGNFQTSTTTATYIGETPFTANAALSLSGLINPDPDLLDLERIEVLKGPQGTLYGASSLGGLIRLIPKEPDPTKSSSEVRVDGSGESDGGYGGAGRVSVNVPLAENAAIRINGFYKDDPGFTTNLETGHHNLGNTHAEGGSLALKVIFSDRWDAKVSGLYEDSRTHGFQWQSNAPGTGTPLYGEREYSYAYDGDVHSRLVLLESTSNYRFDVGTLTGTLSYGNYAIDIYRDFTKVYGFVDTFFAPPGALPANTTVLGMTGPNAGKTTGEVRFAANRIGHFEYLGGVFFTHEDTQYPVSIANESPPGVPIQTPAYRYIGDINSLNSYKEYAGFGDATYYITDDVDLTGGLRYSHNTQQIQVEIVQPGMLPLPPSLDDFSSSSTLYQASLRWRPNADLSLYVRAANGYRPGGTQTLVGTASVPHSYTPDTTETVETGLKGQVANRRLSYELAAYHTDWKDIHLTALTNGVGYVLNGGDAKVDGVEGQLDWGDSSGLKAGVAAAYSNARLTSISADSAASIHARVGDPLPGAPRFSAVAHADYFHALTDRVTGFAGASLTYQGDKNSSYPGNLSDVNYNMPGYALLDLRTGVLWSNYTVDFRVENVANRNGVTGSYVQATIPGTAPEDAYLTRPRTFAASFRARW